MGRSKGGFSTKIHAFTDALGSPLDFVLTGGQAGDIGQAENLLALTTESANALLGDKGYEHGVYTRRLSIDLVSLK